MKDVDTVETSWDFYMDNSYGKYVLNKICKHNIAIYGLSYMPNKHTDYNDNHSKRFPGLSYHIKKLSCPLP